MRVDYGIGIGFDRNNEPVENVEQKIESAEFLLASTYGGYNIVRGMGGWNDGEKLIREASIVFTVDTYGGDIRSKEVALRLREIFNQTAVHVTVFPDACSVDVRE